MALRTCGRALVLLCVLALLASAPASAGDGLVDVNVTVDADDTAEGATNVTDATLDGTLNASVSSDALDTDSTVTADANLTADANTTADATVTTDASANESGTVVTADASTNVSGTTVDAETTADAGETALTAETDANTSGGTASLDADVNQDDLSLDADANLGGSVATVTADVSTGDASLRTGPDADLALTDDGRSPATDGPEDQSSDGESIAGPAADGPTAPGEGPSADTSESASSSGDSGGDPLGPSGGGTGPTAAVGLVAVAGTAATRRGLSAVGSGTAPLAALHEALVAAVHFLRSKLLAVVPLRYSRRDDSDPLEHDVRADLYDAVETAPGLHLSGLDDRADVSLSSVRHHLRVLEDECLVESELVRGKRRYFPAHATDTELRAALDEPATASVLRSLARTEPATVSDLAESLGRDPSTISHHLSGLEDAGLVERERDGQAVVTRLADGPKQVLVDEAPVEAVGSAD